MEKDDLKKKLDAPVKTSFSVISGTSAQLLITSIPFFIKTIFDLKREAKSAKIEELQKILAENLKGFPYISR